MVRLTALDYTEHDLRTDARDPRLEIRVRGSLLLLSEDLADSARWSLIEAIDALATSTDSHDAHHAATWCTSVLGADEHGRRRRRRRR